MEIFLFYNSIFSVCILLGMILSRAHFIGLIAGTSVWLALFILQGFGLCKMAKKRKLKKRWLAFVPFVNLLYMGKLAGTSYVFGQKLKHAGLYAMIAQIVSTIFCAMIIAAVSYLFIVEGEPTSDDFGVPYWGGTGFSAQVENFYHISAGYNTLGISVLSIFQLAYEILLFILTMTLYRKYCPKAYGWLSFLTILIPWSRYIVIFCIRNRDEIDYEAYVRARREEFARRYQQRYGNPYGGNPYNNPYGTNNPYGNGSPYGGQNGQNAQQPPRPEEPFSEFGGEKKDEKENGSDDGFFH